MSKVLNNLGLAKRASCLITGTDRVIEGLRNNQILLIFLASDSANNTIKKINDKAFTYNCDVNSKYTSEQLSQALGLKNCHVIGIMDRGFAKLLKE